MMSLKEIWSEFITSFQEINLGESFGEILKNPLTILTLLGIATIIAVLMRAKRIEFNANMITRIGVALALSTVLNELKIYQFPQGGGVTLASLVPLIIVAFMYGPEVGLLAGFTFGVLNLIFGPYILHPIQVLFDYPLPFMAIGIVGFFRNFKNPKMGILIGSGVAIFFKFLAHFISGYAFFGQFAPDGTSAFMYSLGVNASLIGLDGIIVLVVLSVIPLRVIIGGKQQRIRRKTESGVA